MECDYIPGAPARVFNTKEGVKYKFPFTNTATTWVKGCITITVRTDKGLLTINIDQVVMGPGDRRTFEGVVLGDYKVIEKSDNICIGLFPIGEGHADWCKTGSPESLKHTFEAVMVPVVAVEKPVKIVITNTQIGTENTDFTVALENVSTRNFIVTLRVDVLLDGKIAKTFEPTLRVNSCKTVTWREKWPLNGAKSVEIQAEETLLHRVD